MSNLLTFQSREQWLQHRRIGASDAAAIWGVGYAGTNAWTVWHRLVHGSDEVGDQLMRNGTLLEPAVRAIFTDETGIDVQLVPPYSTYIHAEIPYMSATPDGLVRCLKFNGKLGVWEGKAPTYHAYDEWRDGAVPLKHLVQVQHQLDVLGLDYGYLFGFIAGEHREVRLIERHEAFIQENRRKLAKFWEYVEKKEPPPIDASVEVADVLAKLHPEDNGKAIALPDDATLWLRMREWAKAHKKVCERVEREAENRIKAALGPNTYGIVGDTVLQWKSFDKAGYTVEPRTERRLTTIKRLPKGVDAPAIEGETHGDSHQETTAAGIGYTGSAAASDRE